MRARLIIVITVVGLMGLLTAAALLYRSARMAHRAEEKLHAYYLTMDVVTLFVESEGRWPSSWDELEGTVFECSHGNWKWPDDRRDLEKLVTVDFSVQLEDLSKQAEDRFDAVTVAPPSFAPDGYKTKKLLRTAKEHRQTEEETTEEKTGSGLNGT